MLRSDRLALLASGPLSAARATRRSRYAFGKEGRSISADVPWPASSSCTSVGLRCAGQGYNHRFVGGALDRSAQLLAELDDDQTQAVTHGEGPLLVVAGAGSGKTRVLTYRVAWLLAKG